MAELGLQKIKDYSAQNKWLRTVQVTILSGIEIQRLSLGHRVPCQLDSLWESFEVQTVGTAIDCW
jgi:hypothetical protein